MAEPAQKKARTERTFLFSSESVNEGHPDKLCDQVSDAVLDACLKEDPRSKVACESASKDNMVMVFGEITTQSKLDYDTVVRGVVISGFKFRLVLTWTVRFWSRVFLMIGERMWTNTSVTCANF